MRSTAILLLSFLFCTFFSTAEVLTLKGTIGKSKVVMEINAEDGDLSGSYFYEKNCLDIPLTGSYKVDNFEFFAGSHQNEDADNEHFRLTRKENSFSGEWKYKGKTLPVALVVIKRPEITNTYSVTNPVFAKTKHSVFEHYRTSLATFKRIDSVTIINGVTFQWFKENHFELYIFRAIKGLPMDKIKFLNDYLENVQLEDFTKYGSCGFGQDASGYSGWISDWFMNKDFFSFRINYEYYCGGTYPDYSKEFHNIDLNGKRALTTDDILLFPGGKNGSGQFKEWSEEWSDYRKNVFAEKVYQLMKKRYPENFYDIPEEELEDEYYCLYGPEAWTYSDVIITKDGLLFTTAFNHNQRDCEEPGWTVLPYSDVKEWLPADLKSAFLNIR